MKYLTIATIIVIIQVTVTVLDLLFPFGPIFSWSLPIVVFGLGIIWGLTLEVGGWVDI